MYAVPTFLGSPKALNGVPSLQGKAHWPTFLFPFFLILLRPDLATILACTWRRPVVSIVTGTSGTFALNFRDSHSLEHEVKFFNCCWRNLEKTIIWYRLITLRIFLIRYRYPISFYFLNLNNFKSIYNVPNKFLIYICFSFFKLLLCFDI